MIFSRIQEKGNDHMMKINTVRTAIVCGGAALAFGTDAIFAAESQGRTQPNVLILLADDMGYADCGAYGSKDIPTPNIDALAQEGTLFSNGYSSASVCSPSRAGLLTGRYQQRFGFDANAEGRSSKEDKGPRALDIKQTTIAQHMKTLGYTTGIIGKWHVGGSQEGYRPVDRGFDEFYGFYPHGLPTPIYRNAEPVPEQPPNAMEAFATEALSFIDRHEDKPFLLYLPFSAVHRTNWQNTTPFFADPWLNMVAPELTGKRRSYAADVMQMDDIIGRIVNRLAERGLEENTLIFFINDNGGTCIAPSNAPLRGYKWRLWEGGIRVPFIVRWKGRLPGGRTMDQPVIALDIMPTAIAAAGGEIKTKWQLDGANLLPLLEGRTNAAPHDALYWRFGVQYAVRQGNWKLVKPQLDMPPLLFNLTQDIGENHDLASAHPDKVRQLQRLWDAWEAKNEAPRWIDVRWNGVCECGGNHCGMEGFEEKKNH